MANTSMMRTKKSNNTTQRRLMAKYAIDETDLAFCDLMASGWKDTLAAYYAYGLSSEQDATILNFISNQKRFHPGINEYIHYLDERAQSDTREIQREKQRLDRQIAESTIVKDKDKYDLRSKQGMLEYLIDLSETSGLDLKTKADLAKQITDLQNYKKEDVKIEDNRINFYLPITCKYCDKCEQCQVKEWAKENGCQFKNINGTPKITQNIDNNNSAIST